MMTVLAGLTVLVSFALRWRTAGWLAIMWWTGYLVFGGAHVAVHAVHELREGSPRSPSRALISNSLFLLAFLLQWDVGDTPGGWFTIAALPCGGPGGVSGIVGNCPMAPDWWPGPIVNLALGVPVVATWILLLKRPDPRTSGHPRKGRLQVDGDQVRPTRG
jgi:hypothetical protein